MNLPARSEPRRESGSRVGATTGAGASAFFSPQARTSAATRAAIIRTFVRMGSSRALTLADVRPRAGIQRAVQAGAVGARC